MKNSEDVLKNLCDNIKQTNIYIIGVPEGAETENLLEGKKRLKSSLAADIQIKETWRIPNKPRETHIKTYCN